MNIVFLGVVRTGFYFITIDKDGDINYVIIDIDILRPDDDFAGINFDFINIDIFRRIETDFAMH